MARTRLYQDGKLIAEDFPAAEVSDHLEDPSSVVWLDLCLEQGDKLETVSEELNLHPLAVEDAVQPHERPKLDRYEHHLFLSAYKTGVDRETGEIALIEVAAFVTKQALVTVRKSQKFRMDPVVERWDNSPDLAKFGVGFLLYGLVDYVVDSHFEAVQVLDDEIEGLQDLLFEERPLDKQVQRRSFELRRSLVLLRRVVLPMREVVNALMRRDLHVVDEGMALYFQDVYDHVLRATEWTESLRDLVTTILETNLTLQGNRLNTVMKKVTSWAAIIAVPTAVTGFYGQNVKFPGFGSWWGFVTSVVLMASLSGSLFVIFRKHDWL